MLWRLSGNIAYCAIFSPNPQKQTEKFLVAVQKKDFKTIFEMTYYYQMELSRIKSNNPKALWQKLTTEYYESKKNALFSRKEESLTDAWVRFGGEVFGTLTDPVENIRALMRLLTQSCKWRVIESKKEKHHDQWSGRQQDVNVIYVSLKYKTVEESPLIGSKALKEAILGFVLDGKTGLYMRSSKIGKGDVYWELPLRAYGISYKYEGGKLRLAFQLDGGIPQLEGGKPPYKYDFFLNGKTPQDFLRRYTISILKGERRFEERQVQRYPLYKIFYGNKESEKYGRNLMTDEKLGWGVKTPDCSFCVELETTPLTQFAWPPGISFPIQVKAVVRDSSNPPKQVVQEMVIPEGTKGFPKPWVNWQYGTYTLYWLEIDRKMYLPEGLKWSGLSVQAEAVYK